MSTENRDSLVHAALPRHGSDLEYDIIIIGAGINGAGVARDAAMRGLNVLLLDKEDFSAGTTAWSTRLIHGGLRYLEHGELSLVRESLRERETLLGIAPHLIRPLPTLVPIYTDRSRGQSTIRLGMLAYDLLSFDKSLPKHRRLSREQTILEFPGLRTDGLKSAVMYYDAQVEFAERLVVENALSARQNGATIHTHAKVECVLTNDRAAIGVRFADEHTGKEHEARGTLVINASGPWVDRLLARGPGMRQPLIGGTKGSHLIVSAFPGAPETAIYVEAMKDRRPVFIIPWNNNYLIGTTDIRYDGSLDHIEITDEETEYLLSETNQLIPSAQLTRSSILYTYAGVRPLAHSSKEDERGITRRHFIREDPEIKGLFSLVGGKLTTYRRLSEETVDICLRRLGKEITECRTAIESLPGAPSPDSAVVNGVSAQSVAHLNQIYGSRARDVIELTRGTPGLLEVFDDETGAIGAEVVFAFESEMALTLADCMLRRTMVGLNSSCGLNSVRAASAVAGRHLGWDDERMRQEVKSYEKYVERFRPQSVLRVVDA